MNLSALGWTWPPPGLPLASPCLLSSQTQQKGKNHPEERKMPGPLVNH